MYMYEKKSTKGKAAAVILMTMILILISGFHFIQQPSRPSG